MRSRLRNYVQFAGMLVFVCLMFTITHLLTRGVYRIIGWTPPLLPQQIITSLSGLVLMGVTIGMLTRAFRSKIASQQMRVFSPIIEALGRIAQGDFSARVDGALVEGPREKAVVGELVQSVNQMALQLDQMESLRQEFISNVSHELQSPLTSIRGFAQALRNDHLTPEERHHYLGIIDNESMRLSRVTENLLRLATLESERAKFEPKPYRLDRQIRSLVLACEPQWTAKTLDMEVTLPEVEITADQDLLSQVWTNLLHNSIKFTPAGGQIALELTQHDHQVEFTIRDTGIGIADTDLPHIFERFYKADRSRTRSDGGGSGLGLSIVHKIVEMHQGTVAVTSQPGAGTTFTVRLPISP